jgi:hypothetical protein
MRARRYEPGTGAFSTRDADFAATDTAYTYAGDDPFNGWDLTGMWCILGHNPNGSCRGTTIIDTADPWSQNNWFYKTGYAHPNGGRQQAIRIPDAFYEAASG